MANKVICGGFKLGDGLTMDGDTLKVQGGGSSTAEKVEGEGYSFGLNDQDAPQLVMGETTIEDGTAYLLTNPATVQIGGDAMSVNVQADTNGEGTISCTNGLTIQTENNLTLATVGDLYFTIGEKTYQITVDPNEGFLIATEVQ